MPLFVTDADPCFITLWCRNICLSIASHQVRIRNYPLYAMDYTDWKIFGKFCGAEQRGDPSAQRTGTTGSVNWFLFLWFSHWYYTNFWMHPRWNCVLLLTPRIPIFFFVTPSQLFGTLVDQHGYVSSSTRRLMIDAHSPHTPVITQSNNCFCEFQKHVLLKCTLV